MDITHPGQKFILYFDVFVEVVHTRQRLMETGKQARNVREEDQGYYR